MKNEFVQVQVRYELDPVCRCIYRRAWLGGKVLDQTVVATISYEESVRFLAYLNQGNELGIAPELVEWA